MKVTLTAPFRADINFDTRLALHKPSEINKLLSQCAVQSSNDTFKWVAPLSQPNENTLQYQDLDDICIPSTAKPSLKLQIEAEKLNEYLKTKEEIEKLSLKKVISAEALYFDNTIGILIITISLEKDACQFDSSLDRGTNELCGGCLSFISDTEKLIIKKIRLETKKSDLKIFKEKYDIFSELPTTSKESYKSRIMWVSRVALLHKKEKVPIEISSWMKVESLEHPNFKLNNCNGYINVGNSVFIGSYSKIKQRIIIDSYVTCNYFYALYDIINRELRRTLIEESVHKEASRKTILRLIKSQEYIRFLKLEFDDYKAGVQGVHSIISRQLIKSWELDRLIESANEKIDLISSFTERILNEKRHRYNKIIESALVAIAGVTALQFTLEIFQYQHLPQAITKDFSGVFNLLNIVDVDTALHITLFVVVVISLLVIRKR